MDGTIQVTMYHRSFEAPRQAMDRHHPSKHHPPGQKFTYNARGMNLAINARIIRVLYAYNTRVLAHGGVIHVSDTGCRFPALGRPPTRV